MGVWIDGVLKNWGDRLYYEKVRGVGQTNIFGKRAKSVVAYRGSSANGVRRKIYLTAKKTPEVMIKVTGGGKSISAIKKHLDYISRNGKVDLENERGEILGQGGAKEIRDDWQDSGYPLPADEGTKRESFNVVLSMPHGTDPQAVLSSARAFAQEEFTRHQYALALHDGREDDHLAGAKGGKNTKKKAPNPHVHICVKAVDLDGHRLNPRKADLQRWREKFAEKLIERGIEANATPRHQRGQQRQPEKQKNWHMYQRTDRKPGVRTAGQGGAKRVNETMGIYEQMAQSLKQSDNPDDRELSKLLHQFVHEKALHEGIQPEKTPKSKQQEREKGL